MSTLQDCIRSVVGDTINDGLRAHYLANGATSTDGALKDVEREFLIANVSSVSGTGKTNQDLWMEGLNDLGLTGTLNDRLKQFWEEFEGQFFRFAADLRVNLSHTGNYTLSTPAAASVRYVEDHDNVLRAVNSGEMRFKHVRRIENLIGQDESSWTLNQNVTDNGDGTYYLEADGDGTTGVDRRAFLSRVFTIKSGAEYFAVFTLANVVEVGPIVNAGFAEITATTPAVTTTPSNSHNIIQNGVDGRFAVKLHAPQSPSDAVGSLRIGFGCTTNLNAGTSGSCTISDIALYEITGAQVDAPAEHVPEDYEGDVIDDNSVIGVRNFDTTNGNTWDSSTGIVTEHAGTLIAGGVRSFDACGDSFADGSDDWPNVVTNSQLKTNRSASGANLVTTVEAQVDAAVAAAEVGSVIVNGGINDIIADQTAENLQTAATNIASDVTGAGMVPVILGVGPWSGNSSWNSARQTVTETYNDWLRDNAIANGFVFVDIYSVLASGNALHADYDSGDGLHPNAAGMIVVRDAIDQALYNHYGFGGKGLLSERTRDNDMANPVDLSTWSTANTGTVVASIDTDPRGGQDGWVFTDNDAANQFHTNDSNIAGHSDGDSVACQCYIKKDAIAKTTRWPAIRARWANGGTAAQVFIGIDTSTGETGVSNDGNGSSLSKLNVREVVMPDGNWWHVTFVSTNNSTGNVDFQIGFQPARGNNTNLTSGSATVTGSATAALWKCESQHENWSIWNEGTTATDDRIQFTENGSSNLFAAGATEDGSWEAWMSQDHDANETVVSPLRNLRYDGSGGGVIFNVSSIGQLARSTSSGTTAPDMTGIVVNAGEMYRGRTRFNGGDTTHNASIKDPAGTVNDDETPLLTYGGFLHPNDRMQVNDLLDAYEHDGVGGIWATVRDIKHWGSDRGDTWLNSST